MVRTLLAILLFSPAIAYACSCASGTPQQYFENADAVFAGMIVGTRVIDSTYAIRNNVEIDFKVSRVWKGDVPELFTIHTTNICCICGWGPGPSGEKGEYVMFARRTEENGKPYFTTSDCSGNTLSPESEIPKLFGPGTAPMRTEARPVPSAPAKTLGVGADFPAPPDDAIANEDSSQSAVSYIASRIREWFRSFFTIFSGQ